MLSLINASVDSFISQVEEEMTTDHEQFNGILPSYPHRPSPPDSSNPYRGDLIVPRSFYHDVSNWQNECTPMQITYQLRSEKDPHWSAVLLAHGWLMLNGLTAMILKSIVNVNP